ncbi:hypothetical protein H845_3538 (plasmid) [Komagataeibacter xylinus E25]|nr:hypothetical protein H845_3538 [Komagataeibacter xylinus E25]
MSGKNLSRTDGIVQLGFFQKLNYPGFTGA